MDKRGISAIVATVLVILVTVAGVAIIWVGVLPMVREGLSFRELDARVSIVGTGGYTAYDGAQDVAVVQVKREIDDDAINRIRIAFIIDGNSYSSSVLAPTSGGTKTYAFNFAGYGAPEFVEVAPIFVSSSGSEMEGRMTSRIRIEEETVNSDGLAIYNLEEDYFEEGEVNCSETVSSCGTPPCTNCNFLAFCTGKFLTSFSCTSNEIGCEDLAPEDCEATCCNCGGYGEVESIVQGNCGDGIDNDCDGDADTDAACIIPCDLTDAYWSQISVTNGTVVQLIVEGTNCDGESIDFSIWEDDVAGDDFVVTITDNYDNASWVSQYQDDISGNPEFYFEAVLVSDPGVSVNSKDLGNPLLEVSVIATCTDLIKNQDETDVDCGGTICGGCDLGKNCSIGSDCLSGDCSGGICVVPGSCAGTDSSCGIFPACTNCTASDGCSGTDYLDYYCSGTSCLFTTDDCSVSCCVCGGYGVVESIAQGNCLDGLNNDCDVNADCDDSGCYGHSTCCSNGVLDGNEAGLDCGGSCTSGTETGSCTGGADDDNDCLIDCADPDCFADPACSVGGIPGDYVSWWKFEGNANDEGGVSDGTLTGDAIIVSDAQKGNVVSLDGVGDYVNLPDSSLYTMFTADEVTYSAWVKLAVAPSGYHNIIGDGQGPCIQINSAGALLYYAGSIKPISLTWTLGQWYHVVSVVYGPDNVTFYRDGVVVGTLANTGQSNRDPDRFWIGGDEFGEYFNGDIDDMMVYNRALSGSEITEIYNAQAPVAFPTDYVAYWKFDGDATDETGTNNGALGGNPQFVPSVNGQALEFDGAGDAVIVPDSVSLSPTGTGLTLTAWVYCNGPTDTDDRIIHKNSAWSLQMGPPCDVLMGMYHGGFSETASPVSCNLNEWCFITGVYNGANMSTYKDGVFITSAAKTGNMADSAVDLYIGVDEDGSSGAFSGSIDDVMVYDRALSEAEIQAVYSIFPTDCGGADTSCGTFPACSNCNFQDGCSGTDYLDYYCSGASCSFTTDSCTDCSCTCGDYGLGSEVGYCTDGKDNDCGGGTDCGDVDCVGDPSCAALTTILFDDFETDFIVPGWYDDGIVFAWARDSAGTSSSSTGPCGGISSCATPAGALNSAGVNTTWYIYVETSSGSCYGVGNTSIVYQSPAINFNAYTGEEIVWWSNMYGANIGTLSLQEDTSGSWVELWTLSGNQGAAWFKTTVDLSGLTGTGNLRFHYTCGGGFAGDVAIDEINITGMS
jgi:hypothetical protein